MKILTVDEIREVLPSLDLMPAIEEGFRAYSEGRAVIPPVGELLLDKGEVHLKYGFIRGEEFYVIKIASGFYGNPALGLPSGNGCLLLFKQETGEAAAILLDEGLLTNVRTAVAGAVAAKYCAPKDVQRIGIVGAGTQARLQLEWLAKAMVTPCRDVLVWGLNAEEVERYRRDMEPLGFTVKTTLDASDVLEACNLVVTATPSHTPLLRAEDLRPGTHITAVGSDTPDKQELDSAILAKAGLVVADSIPQCRLRGEIHKALESGHIEESRCIELGAIIAGKAKGRTSESQITVVDLTGVAVQDLAIASAVFRKLRDRSTIS
ncbi:MAG: ornithine cyclodeaminase family protein [Candidatus Aminicenantes bacterium]|nr:ornithine cyclodeaminase family protein [Candidatus Aminicenantes bacterium]